MIFAKLTAAVGLAALLSGCAPVVIGGIGAGAMSAAQTRSTGEALTDAEIKLRINDALFQRDSTLFSRVQTSVTEGRVVLLGAVADGQERMLAEEVTRAIPEVREVTNELVVADRGWRDIARDTRIDAEIAGRMLAAEDILSINYDVETINGVAHVMGLAQDSAELARVTDLVSRVSGVRQVVSHALLVTDPRRRTTG
ncbi:BON domain-containing protein [Roseobacter sp. HKCCA0434]|uniref:BON domain-containing protein n=1 Tax=Roseobacter sp. HKCCA0434 TaxID=3079297 RepID=UPI002905D019|nr:BON domain-containing protein [Roseobacter sp. HKCCA0434]